MDQATPFPEGYHSISPYLVVKNISDFINFLKEVFHATEVIRLLEDTETYPEVKIGDSILMIVEQRENAKPPNCILWVYVPDVEDAYQKALANGSASLMKPAFKYGTDKMAIVNDPFGIQWRIASYRKGGHQIIMI
jgi:PhnB protein